MTTTQIVGTIKCYFSFVCNVMNTSSKIPVIYLSNVTYREYYILFCEEKTVVFSLYPSTGLIFIELFCGLNSIIFKYH